MRTPRTDGARRIGDPGPMNRRTDEVLANGFTDHVLVCTNDRDSGYSSCSTAHGPAVYEAVKAWLCERGVCWSHVYVAETSCLGLCSAEGAAVVIHPRNRWYSDVRPEEVPDLLGAEFGPDASRLGARADATRATTASEDAE